MNLILCKLQLKIDLVALSGILFLGLSVLFIVCEQNLRLLRSAGNFGSWAFYRCEHY